jgi:hypothetical protein
VNTSTAVKLIAGVTAGVLLWQLYGKAAGALSTALDDLASLPGRAVDAVVAAGQSVVDGTSIISDPAGGGFVKEAPNAGRIVDYSKNRNIDPLIAYFIKWGNTDSARAQAYKAGWTADEISLSVMAMAQANGNL